MVQTTPHICAREREFLDLRGDGTEMVKMTFNWDKTEHSLNGWYLFSKILGVNEFVKQSLHHLPLIDVVLCDTKYFQFDERAGLLPNSFHYNYRPTDITDSNYPGLKARLESRNMWKPIRSVTRWEFVK
jgi:hypothetical protein